MTDPNQPSDRTKQRVIVTLELPSDRDVAIRGLRWLLKRLGRGFGVRCVGLDERSSDDVRRSDVDTGDGVEV